MLKDNQVVNLSEHGCDDSMKFQGIAYSPGMAAYVFFWRTRLSDDRMGIWQIGAC